MKNLFNVAVVGATGLVGSQIIETLHERRFPVGDIRCLAVGTGADEVIEFRGKPVVVQKLTYDSFAGIDIAIFSAGSDCAGEFCPSAAREGAVCIDLSSAWRMDTDVPLVVPEVNPHSIAGYSKKGIISTPNSSVIQLVIALKPLHDYATISRVVVSTYQSVSGSGRKAIDELRKQVADLLNGRPVTSRAYPYQISFNCIPQIGSFDESGSTNEEIKLVNETRKIMEADIRITATAVRVPVFYGHSESVNIVTEEKITADRARGLLKKAPGVKLLDDPVKGHYPMPYSASGQDQVHVGRIREDRSTENGLNLWVVADNIRKGAAVNSVQIAEMLVRDHLG